MALFSGSQITFKDHLKESHLFVSRVLVAWVLGFLAMCGLIYNLVNLQIVHHATYIKQSEENRITPIPIPPTRGLIYDRNGELLAHNLPTFTLEVIPYLVKERSLREHVQALRDIPLPISELDEQRFLKHARQKKYDSIPLRFKLSEQEVAMFSVRRHEFEGTDIQARISRHYPQGLLTSHVIGYVGRIDTRDKVFLNKDPNYNGSLHIGKLGVEKFYEGILHGIVGQEQVETDSRGRRLRVMSRKPPKTGQSIHLTLDMRLQRAAAKMLEGKRASVVAINPKNGEILVLLSLPSFDPNLFVNGIDTTTYNELNRSIDRPLYNRALKGQYPPGSTIKPFMALAGLENSVVRPEDKIPCNGSFLLPGTKHRFRDWKKRGHGSVDLDRSIVQSCDVYYYRLAYKMGIEHISGFLSQFGFGSKTHVDLTDEDSGILPSIEWKRRARKEKWFAGDTVNIGIGQGVWLVTPMQLASAVATLAARGQRFQPRVLHSVINEKGQIEPWRSYPHAPIQLKNASDWDTVLKAMQHVVHTPAGTAYARVGRLVEYELGGKTGTAQVFGFGQEEDHTKMQGVKERLQDHALFIAFAPANDPTIAMAVIVENGGHGSSGAAPVAKAVLDEYFKHY